MLQKGFVVAMAASIGLACYDRPSIIRRTIERWLIVSRWGPFGEYLTISTTRDRCDVPASAAPDGLAPLSTALGILLPGGDGPGEAAFLLVRHLPPALRIAGVFFPADGYVRIARADPYPSLVGDGRHAHSRGRRDGAIIRHDVPDPAPGCRGAVAWHLRACRRPWTGEVSAATA